MLKYTSLAPKEKKKKKENDKIRPTIDDNMKR